MKKRMLIKKNVVEIKFEDIWCDIWVWFFGKDEIDIYGFWFEYRLDKMCFLLYFYFKFNFVKNFLCNWIIKLERRKRENEGWFRVYGMLFEREGESCGNVYYLN